MGDLEPTAPPDGPLTLREALREARHDWLDLERGALGTLIDLTVRPAKVMRAYLYERRRDYVRPLRYLLFSVAIQVGVNYALLNSSLVGNVAEEQPEAIAQASWLLDHAAVLTLLLIPLFAGILRLCFMRHGVRYVDALVVASYTQAQLNLFSAAVVFPVVYVGGMLFPAAAGIVALAYGVFAWASFPTTGRWWARALLALLALALAQALNGGMVALIKLWL